MGRPPCCGDEEGAVKKGAWTAEEDEKLVAFIQKNKGHGSWRTLPKLAGLERCGKSCRLRWTNYLRPNIKRGNFSPDEERAIVQLHAVMGNKWSTIASHLPGRTDNEVKNHWNTHLKKRLTKMGIDPQTHLPFSFFPAQSQLHRASSTSMSSADWQKALLQHSLQVNSTIACHLVQWELARVEAETRQQLQSSHSYASWLNRLHQNQTPAYDLDALLKAVNVQTQPLHNQILPIIPSSAQFHSSQSSSLIQSYDTPNNDYLGNTSLAPYPANNAMSPRTSALQTLSGSPISNEDTEHLQEECVVTSASGGSTGTLDSCSSSDSLSSQLLPPSKFDLPSLDLSSDESYHTGSIVSPHETTPLSLVDNPNSGQQDSYWNRILSSLDHVTLENL